VTRIANTGITKGLGTQEEVTNFKVEVGILDKIAGIRPGMSATVDIQVEKHDSTLYIPIQCVSMRYPKEEATKEDSIKKNDKKGMKDKKGKKPKSSRNNPNPNEMKNKNEEKMIEVVFMVMEGDTARMIPVKTGITSDTDIEVLSGLKEGERVVSGPYRLLATKIQDGDLVREDLTIKETRETEEERQPSGMD
jgi:HlyD family secretion protein